jgi:hypothetical protein
MSEPDGEHARRYLDIARKVWDRVSAGADSSRKSPNIVMQ